MLKSFLVSTCHECDKIITCEQITGQECIAYQAKGFQLNVESLPATTEVVNVVYNSTQDICSDCTYNAAIDLS